MSPRSTGLYAVCTCLVEELETLLKDAADTREANIYKEALVTMQELIHRKHLLTAEEILKRANEDTDTETGNMKTVVRDENITLCLWANLEKNPRFKGLNFDDTGFGFELPKQLAVSDVAVRILHTRYDHLSLLAWMTHAKIHTANQRTLAPTDKTPEDDHDPEGEEKAKDKGEVKGDKMLQQRVDEEMKSLRGLEGTKSAVRKNSAQPPEGRRSHIQTQMEALSAEVVLTSPAEELTAADQTDRVLVVDLMEYTPLGGVFYFDVFHLPPQARRVNEWEIRQLLDTGLQMFCYPTGKTSSPENEAHTCPPVGVSVRLPDCVVFLEPPLVARWDTADKQWRTDGITDVSYSQEEDNVSFKMDSFHAFVLMQETYINLPLQRWELRPLGRDSAVFTFNGAFITLIITVQGDRCMLQSDDHRGLSHILGQWLSSAVLQRAMIKAGVNVFVNEFTDRYVSSCGKDPLTEHAAYEQMALVASACAFSWSKWNTKCSAEHLMVQACEHHGPGPVSKDSWHLYLLGAQMSQKLEMRENGQTLSLDHHPGSEFHSTFIHMLQEDMSDDGRARSRDSSFLFVNTVQSLLCATRPLMFS
ncbi:dynein axonemal intermediate chain 7 isoform X3 [Cynoglossus semilaevis]|uniref:dynein axonemal intermediate chain 7 isoform X3 n=1 Tax=Cynoglossus semilaevis TaxID=244447 RepID=UPI000D62B252|nr:protein CASC1 isoform X3 [Cynoglossus semilaevis]XP_024913210.1 protein CASC1 isoform X3 [Cynoglossus semilaevis]